MTDALVRVFFPPYIPNLVRAILARPRLAMWIQVTLLAYIVMVVAAPPAFAGVPDPLKALDRKDSSGYMVSNYNIEYLLDWVNIKLPFESLNAWLIQLLWEVYRRGIGVVALLLDYTLTFKWLDYLTYPVEQCAKVLDNVLDQVPMLRELLFLLAVGIGLLKLLHGNPVKGVTEMLGSMAAWGISAAIVVNPVSWVTGPDGILTRTKEAVQQLSAQLVSPDIEAGQADPADAAGSMAQQLVTIFVRKPHQFLAYGGLADGGGCEKTYDDNLKKSGEDLANAMLKCSPDFGENIKHPSVVLLVTAFILLFGAVVVMAVVVLCAVMMLYESANFLLVAVHGVWELFRSVGPGESFRGLVGLFQNGLESVAALFFVVLVNAAYLATIMYIFTEWDEQMIVLFLVVDLLLLVVIAMLIVQRGKIRKAFQRMRERTKAKGANNLAVPRRLNPGHLAMAGASAVGSRMGSRRTRADGTEKPTMRSRIGGAGKKAGSLATAPARAASRHVTRPGFMSGRLATGTARRAGALSKVSNKRLRGMSYALGEKKWEKKEAKKQAARTQKRERRDARRLASKHWTWGGAKREAMERDKSKTTLPQQENADSKTSQNRPKPAQQDRARKSRDAAQKPIKQTPAKQTPAKQSEAQWQEAPEAQRGKKPQRRASSETGKSTERQAGAGKPSTKASGSGKKQGSKPVPAKSSGGQRPSAKESLHAKLKEKKASGSSSPKRTVKAAPGKHAGKAA
ncbi:hypothetical protein [Brachybacterium kimchii]|uniref:Uncharacterized protein n=1 Tax=Brachybacterium kimchii TaxID=2942909 RepID=A0ABY4NDN9_9MICO|nr:hypothetical protein [Brachybacterium kimchii]UQN31808.1 hypothetical protein M4486_19655 [Brachybacterium kimchii]